MDILSSASCRFISATGSEAIHHYLLQSFTFTSGAVCSLSQVKHLINKTLVNINALKNHSNACHFLLDLNKPLSCSEFLCAGKNIPCMCGFTSLFQRFLNYLDVLFIFLFQTAAIVTAPIMPLTILKLKNKALLVCFINLESQIQKKL